MSDGDRDAVQVMLKGRLAHMGLTVDETLNYYAERFAAHRIAERETCIAELQQAYDALEADGGWNGHILQGFLKAINVLEKSR